LTLSLPSFLEDLIIFASLSSSSTDPVIAKRRIALRHLIERDGIKVIEPSSLVDPWDIDSIPDLLLNAELRKFGADTNFVFDVTGGTKAMSIGLSRVAAQVKGEMVYLESESLESSLRHYTFDANGALKSSPAKKITEKVDLKDFFFVQLGLTEKQLAPVLPKNPNEFGARFESELREILQKYADEMMYAIKPIPSEEIDIILRKRRRVAIVECKTGDSAKSVYGILQLNNIASERYLGTYTQKILAVTVNYQKESNRNYQMAHEHGVHVLELPAWQPGHKWSQAEHEQIKQLMQHILG